MRTVPIRAVTWILARAGLLSLASSSAGLRQIPASARSRQAGARASARLASRLSQSGLRMGAPVFIRISAALRDGQSAFQVHIFRFRMTSANLERHRHSEWLDFWSNLKEGYDLFERDQLPPRVTVRGGRYSFTRG